MSETEITDSKITFDGVYPSEYAPKDKGIWNRLLSSYAPEMEAIFGPCRRRQ
jgi:hypothetical protein